MTDGSEGQVFKFDKAVNDRRCEAHGAKNFNPAIGSTYYIGWRFKLSSLVDDNAVFQWKSYGSPMVQNFPLVIKMVGRQSPTALFPSEQRRCAPLVAQYFSQHVLQHGAEN